MRHKRIKRAARHKRVRSRAGRMSHKARRPQAPGEDTANLRAILIMLVMMYHSTIIYGPDFPAYRPATQFISPAALPVAGPIVGIVSFALFTPMMGLFFMLSGYSFVFTLKKSTDYGVLIRKKFWRLLVPLLFVGLCWMIPIKLLVGHPQYRDLPLPRVLWEVFVTGRLSGHLWFVAVLFMMFAISGICYHCFGLTRRADCAVIVETAVCYAALLVLRSHSVLLDYLFRNYAFFVLGLMLHRHGDWIARFVTRRRNWPLLALGVALLAGAAFIPSHTLRLFVLPVLCMPAPLLLFRLIPKRSNRFFILIGDNSMRLYLLHSPLLYFSFAYWLNINPMAMTLINFVGWGAVALGVGLLLARLHLGVLLGERDFHARPV